MDSDEPTHRTRHDWSSNVDLGYSIVVALSAVSGRRPERIRPLFDTVDPESLEEVFGAAQGAEGPVRRVEVEFEHEGYRVRVTDDGTITLRRVRPSDDAEDCGDGSPGDGASDPGSSDDESDAADESSPDGS